MDKRIKYRIVLDTETCPIVKMEEVKPSNMLTYDIGFAVVDKNGNIYEKHSYIVSDIFFRESEKMKSAYYASKIPMYLADIDSGKRIVKSWKSIRWILLDTMKKYNINEVYAHNMRFDLGTLNKTNEYLTGYKYFFPYGVKICDTLKMARQTIGKQKNYKKFCSENGYMTRNNLPQFKAEVIYKYISGNNDFIESHTGLEDVLIETQIMAKCFRAHKKMTKELFK